MIPDTRFEWFKHWTCCVTVMCAQSPSHCVSPYCESSRNFIATETSPRGIKQWPGHKHHGKASEGWKKTAPFFPCVHFSTNFTSAFNWRKTEGTSCNSGERYSSIEVTERAGQRSLRPLFLPSVRLIFVVFALSVLLVRSPDSTATQSTLFRFVRTFFYITFYFSMHSDSHSLFVTVSTRSFTEKEMRKWEKKAEMTRWCYQEEMKHYIQAKILPVERRARSRRSARKESIIYHHPSLICLVLSPFFIL
jgi:hypothetical protein